MKKLLVYPFTKDMAPLARFRNMLVGYELAAAIPPKGFGWEGKDACELDGGPSTGFICGHSFTDELQHCDAVMISDHPQYEAMARDAGKEILTFPAITMDATNEYIEKNILLNEIPVPVIMVIGQGENCQKFDIQLGLREAFVKDGYKVSQFGTKPYSKLFGIEPLPYMPDISVRKKIHLYNNLFDRTYKAENPDVMIIGIPGGIMPINSYEYGSFGEDAIALTTAAKPDVAIESIYFCDPMKEYFDEQQRYVRYRLGVEVLFFHAANTKFINNSNLKKNDYLTLESNFVLKKLDTFVNHPDIGLFNALIPNTYDRAYRRIIEKLQDNACVV